MAKITPRQYAQALHKALNESPEYTDQIIENFVKTLAKQHTLRYADRIVEALESIYREEHGEQELEVTTVHPLSDTTKRRIEKAFGGKVRLVEKIDESLIGGIKVKTKDTVIDASIKQQLQRLHNTLTA